MRQAIEKRISRKPLMDHRRGGLTLVEILIVAVIIAVLMGILIVALGPVMEHAKKMVSKNRMDQMVMGLASYHHDIRAYPVTQDADPPGSTVVAQALLGEIIDGEAQGLYHAGRRYGPYMDYNADWVELSGTDPVGINDLYGNPILYYHRVGSRIPDPEDNSSPPLWGPDGRFDSDHNDFDPKLEDTMQLDASAYDTDSAEAIRRSVRSARYILVSAGPDEEFGTEDDEQETGP